VRDHGLAPKASRFEDTLLDLDAGVQLLADCGLARYILVGRAWGPIAFSTIRSSGKPAMDSLNPPPYRALTTGNIGELKSAGQRGRHPEPALRDLRLVPKPLAIP
jgi:hypothetical protein